MKLLNRACSIITVSCVIAMQVCFPVFAMATASDADYTTVDDSESNELINDIATSSDADSDFTVIELSDSFEQGLTLLSSANNGISLTSSLASITNTVDYSSTYVQLGWYDLYNDIHYAYGYPDSNGYFAVGLDSDEFGDFDHFYRIAFGINKGGFPSAGNYRFAVDFVAPVGWSYSDYTYLYTQKTNTNANTQSAGSSSAMTFEQYSGDFYAYTDLSIGSINALQFIIYPADLYNTSFQYFSGYVKFAFTILSTDASVTYSSAGGSYSSEDAVTDTASNTASIASSTADMADTLKEIVQTISNQLAALWDQIYNYQHLEDMANADQNADKIVNALGNELSVQIENDNSIADQIMTNDNQNTDTIVNGYDSTANDSTNNAFSEKSNEYDAVEDEIFDAVSEPLESFSYDDYSFSGFNSSVLSAMRWVSDEFMDLFNGMGDFNVPITCSLVLIVVTTLIGYYRIRSGG